MHLAQLAIGGDGTPCIDTTLQTNKCYEYMVINAKGQIGVLIDDQGQDALVYLGWAGKDLEIGQIIRCKQGRADEKVEG